MRGDNDVSDISMTDGGDPKVCADTNAKGLEITDVLKWTSVIRPHYDCK